jgi:hypothetical protein
MSKLCALALMRNKIPRRLSQAITVTILTYSSSYTFTLLPPEGQAAGEA